VGTPKHEFKFRFTRATIATSSFLLAVIFCSIAIDFALSDLGPVQIWFHSWEGDVTIADSSLVQDVILKPRGQKPTIVAIRVSSDHCLGKVYLPAFDKTIDLSTDCGQLFVFDWYGGDCLAKYVPSASDNEPVRVRWTFGY